MRRGLWILGGMGIAGLGLLAWMSQSLVSSVAGVEEARGLQDSFRASAGGVVDPETLRVARTPGAGADRGFLWILSGDLLPGVDPAGTAFSLWRERIVARCLGTGIRGKAPSGVRLLLRRGERAPMELEFDARGMPLRAPAPAPPAPPAGAR